MMNSRLARSAALLSMVAPLVCAVSSDAAAVPGRPAVASRQVAGPGRIVGLGDSLTVSPSRATGFPAELEKRLSTAGGKWTVVNAGVRGAKTAQGLRRLG